MAKLIVELPEHVHAQLKRHAALTRCTIKTTVTALLQQYLQAQARREPMRRSTGFCGAWKGEPSAHEWLAELKAARRWQVGRSE